MPSIDELLADPRTRGLVQQYLGADAFASSGVALEDTATPKAFAGADAHEDTPTTHASPAPTMADRARSFISGAKSIPEATLNRLGQGFDADARQILEGAGVPTVKRVEPQVARAVANKPPPSATPGKSKDPESPESQRWRTIVKETVPGWGTEEALGTITEENGAEVLRRALEAQRIEAGREGEVGTDKRSQAERSQRAAQFAATLQLDWAKLGQAERLALERLGDAADRANAGTESGLRKELMGHPTTKAYQEAGIAFDKVKRAAADPSAAGDLALIFGFMKTLDPGSTVREGEFANAQNAGGVDDRIAAAYNRVVSGERLTGAQRADFIKSAQGQFDAHRAAYETLAKAYEGLAPPGSAGRVVPDITGTKTPHSPISPQTPASTAPPMGTPGQTAPDTNASHPPSAGKVRVRINGKIGLIPRDNLEAAKARGAVEVQ